MSEFYLFVEVLGLPIMLVQSTFIMVILHSFGVEEEKFAFV